jgi:hypothetical protein
MMTRNLRITEMVRLYGMIVGTIIVLMGYVVKADDRSFPLTAAIDSWKAITSYEVRFSCTSSEFSQKEDGKSTERAITTHHAIWVDRIAEKMVFLSKRELIQEGKKYAPCRFCFFDKGMCQTKTSSGQPKKESMTFDRFVTLAQVPIPELACLGSFPSGMSEPLSSFLDSLTPSSTQPYSQKRFEDGTILLSVASKDSEGIEGKKSIFIDAKTLMPTKVSWDIGGKVSESSTVISTEKNGFYLPKHVTARATQKVSANGNSKERTEFEDREIDFVWTSINEPVQFPPWHEIVSMDPSAIDERFLKPYATEDK